MPPQAQTVELPKRLPLLIMPENRGLTPEKDSRLVNCYTERSTDGTYWIRKRFGLQSSSQPPGTVALGFGLWNWLGDIYAVFGATLYKNGVAVAGTLDTTGGVYRFDSCKGATPKLQLGNGVKAYNYDASGGLVEITDADFPTPFLKGWAYLDGTTYVGRPDAGIQGDAINDPTSWDPINVLIAQIEPDQGIALAKQLVYVVEFKQWGTEIFYDAGNPTGSPLGAVQGAKINYGCASADSVRSMDGMLFWAATSQSSAVQVMKMEGLKAEIVSTEPVSRLLDEADFSAVYSLVFKHGGHRFYVLTLKNNNLTLAYDVDQRMWQQWTDSAGNYFPFVATTYNTAMQHIFQHETNGRLYIADETFFTDDGQIITVDVITPNFDGETNRRKQMNIMKFVADQVPGSLLQVRKNDSDYAADKWSNFRRVDLGQRQPMLTNCGTFVRRAYHFRHQSNTPFRLKAIELQLDIGTL